MANLYSLGDLRRGYGWLGHQDHGVTEVSVLHPLFRAGAVGWNRSHDAFPITAYVGTESELLALVRRYAGERMLCYGLNPRPTILRRENGRLRSAKEVDIAVSMNLLIDIDLEGTVTPSRLSALKAFLVVADEYFASLGVSRPFRAATGRGSHLLFGYAPIPVVEVHDVRERLRCFKDGFVQAVREQLDRLEAKVDSTQDLRRMVRVYGTSKPDVGVISKFYGKERAEDASFRERLLRLTVPAASRSVRDAPVIVVEHLPDWFPGLLATDDRLRSLYEGNGKARGDRSASGYDFSVIRHLVRLGFRDPHELGTILSLRPVGLAERCTKGTAYLSRTVDRALS